MQQGCKIPKQGPSTLLSSGDREKKRERKKERETGSATPVVDFDFATVRKRKKKLEMKGSQITIFLDLECISSDVIPKRHSV